MSVELRVMREEELRRVLAMHVQVFNYRRSFCERYASLPAESARVVVDDGRILAALHIFPFGQSFGARVVPCTGIGGVKVAPEARGKGLGSVLMKTLLTDLRSAG